MTSFKEKIKEQKLSEQEMLRKSFRNLEFSIMSDNSSENVSDDLTATQKAVDVLLKYYGKKPVKIPAYIEGLNSRLEYATRPCGIMYRRINLPERWYKDSFGPVIAFTKKDNRPVTLIPNKIRGYTYRDYQSGAIVYLNKFTSQLFRDEAICFYRPLPRENVGKRSLLRYIGQCIPAADYVLAAGATLLVTFITLFIPRVTLLITDYVTTTKDFALFYSISAFLLCVLISSQLIKTVKELIMRRIRIKVSVSVGAAVMSRLLSLPASFFRKYSSGDLYTRVSYSSDLCEILIDNVFSVGITCLFSLLFFSQIEDIASDLIIPSAAVVISIIGVSVVAAVMQARVNSKRMKLAAEETGAEYSLMAGIQRIKTSGAEKRVFSKWADTYAETAKETYNPPFFLKIYPVLPTIISLFGMLWIYFIASDCLFVLAEHFVAFSAAFGIITAAVNDLSQAALSVSQAVPIMEMIKPILTETPEISEDKEIINDFKGNIDVNNLSFSYTSGSTRVLDDFSLHIKEGDYVAIVGKSGSGKSTLMRLLLGFETAEKGLILYDGKDLSRIDLKSLRRSIGTVLQNDTLIFGDIYTNITFHSSDLTLDDAWRAAELAGIADDIRAMPMGMNTMIDESAGTISGGQKQRILIARAIVLNPTMLFFDEATSALDNIVQKQISDALKSLSCTRLVIAHRLSTVKDCDRILVMDKGKIVEEGSYDELVELGGEFATLVSRQMLEAEV